MHVAEQTASRFSELLMQLHNAASAADLDSAITKGVTTLFSDADPTLRELWIDVLKSAQEGSETVIPDQVRDHLLLALVWPHVAQCRKFLALKRTPQEIPVFEPRFCSLTAREKEVIARIALGETDDSIGRALGIAGKTVSKHVENILSKLGAETRTAAVATVYHYRT